MPDMADDEVRTLEGAVNLFLDRRDSLLAAGVSLRSARSQAMAAALEWLGVADQKEEWRPRIKQALARRRAAAGKK